jgi:hypothetical protein
MLHIVTVKWSPAPGYRSKFGHETVNAMRRMVARWYPDPHQFWCITDDSRGIDAGINVLPLWNDYADVPSPHGGKNPSCYRRLKLYASEMKTLIGERFVAIDLDCVITGDLRPLWNRTEDIVLYGDTHPSTHYNGSMTLMTAGCRAKVWETFDPKRSPQLSKSAGQYGSDQGWISYCLGKGEAKFTQADGVWSYRNHIRNKGEKLPDGARVVIFHGEIDPWHPRAQRLDWVRRYYNELGAEVAA